MRKYSKAPIIALVLIYVLGLGSGYALHRSQTKAAENPSNVDFSGALGSIFDGLGEDASAGLKNMANVWNILADQYVDLDGLDLKKMGYGAVSGFVNGVGDSYTYYMPPEEAEEFTISLDGELEGIGAEVGAREGSIIVITPLKKSPAEQAGVQAGDIILAIDDESTEGMSLHQAVTRIRGERGTPVTLTLFREGTDLPFDLTIVRDTITIQSVEYGEAMDGLYVIAVNQFTDQTGPEFIKALDEIILKDPRGVVLDLRFNGGGYLDIAVDMVSEFIQGDRKVVTVARRKAEDNEVYFSRGNPRMPDTPMVVLVNKGSASAAEIVAGAIMDHKRGLIMGEQTFGKGSVQEVERLPDGSILRYTVAKWLTPNNTNIDGTGIEPNRVLEDTNPADDIDEQLEAALAYLIALQ